VSEQLERARREDGNQEMVTVVNSLPQHLSLRKKHGDGFEVSMCYTLTQTHISAATSTRMRSTVIPSSALSAPSTCAIPSHRCGCLRLHIPVKKGQRGEPELHLIIHLYTGRTQKRIHWQGDRKQTYDRDLTSLTST
jgi:hypothetical protein